MTVNETIKTVMRNFIAELLHRRPQQSDDLLTDETYFYPYAPHHLDCAWEWPLRACHCDIGMDASGHVDIEISLWSLDPDDDNYGPTWISGVATASVTEAVEMVLAIVPVHVLTNTRIIDNFLYTMHHSIVHPVQ